MREGESHVGNQKRKCRSAAANNNNMRAWVRIVRQKRLLLFVSWTRSFSLVVSFFFFSLSLFLSLANGWMDGWTFLLLLTAFIPDPLDDVHHGRKKKRLLTFWAWRQDRGTASSQSHAPPDQHINGRALESFRRLSSSASLSCIPLPPSLPLIQILYSVYTYKLSSSY